VGLQLAGLRRWIGASFAPITLLALGAILVWVAIWKVWLPAPDGGSPSRRSATLALALLVLGVGASVLGVFHGRLSSFELDKEGFKITLTKAERDGAHELVEELARLGAPADAYVSALTRYIAQLPRERPVGPRALTAASASSERYRRLAREIADDLG
jgi:hypothetical protein